MQILQNNGKTTQYTNYINKLDEMLGLLSKNNHLNIQYFLKKYGPPHQMKF